MINHRDGLPGKRDGRSFGDQETSVLVSDSHNTDVLDPEIGKEPTTTTENPFMVRDTRVSREDESDPEAQGVYLNILSELLRAGALTTRRTNQSKLRLL